MNSFHKTTKFQLISTYAVVSVYCLELSYVMDAYRARCGNKVCGPQKSDSTNEMIREYCPECICEDICIFFNNCCPDHYFRFRLSCIATSLLDLNPIPNEKSIAMISHCPVSSDNTTKKKCEMYTSLLQKFQNIPVYSRKSGLTYRNIHCSVCHNESLRDIHQWKIEIQCAVFADFNFLSSYSEIFDYAEEKKCDIFYSSSEIYGLHINTCEDNSIRDNAMISKCNVSGTWKKYDADIDFACRIYDNKFYFFKNIFCHLCNPPDDVTINEVISKCNATGLWNAFSADLEKACFNNIQSPLTTPFKNIYCYLCNINDRNKTHNMHFKELVYFIEEKMENKSEFVLQFKSLDLNLESIIDSGTKYIKDTNPETKATGKTKIIQDKDFYNLNKTSIMLQYFAFTGSPLFCQNYSFFSRLSDCDCSDSCYFQSGCCIDKYFQKSTTCTDPQYSDQKNGYLVFDTCTKSMSMKWKKLCSISDIKKFFTFLPVEIQMAESYTHFKNIYCALCSDGLNQSDSQILNSISMWDLNIRCNVYLPPFFFLSFEDYFRFLQENGCSVKYKPSEYTNVNCEEREDKHCNVSGNWMHGDQDIKFACENVNMPRNLYKSKMSVFCEMCNPEQKHKVEYSECNTTGLWENYDKDTEEYCVRMPSIEYLSPYKNKFCEICNQEEGTHIITLESHRKTSDEIIAIEFMPPTFRLIFEFSNNKQSPQHKGQTPSCNASQILILNECRDVRCYPGRMHIDTGCTPLFQTTANLGYILYAGLKASLVTDVNDTMPFLESVGESFKDFLKKRLLLSFIDFETSIIYSNLYCPESKSSNLDKGTKVLILAYHKFFIQDSVNRSVTEETLVSLLGSTFNVTYDDFQQPFLIHHDENAFNLPTLVSRFQFTDKCYTKETSESSPGSLYVHSHVTQLLICEQIEFNYTEFNINLKNLQLTVLSRKVVIEPDEYILISPRQARICVDRLQTLNGSRISFNSGDVWNIIAMVFTCISLLCLFLTFLTYCIFSNLRTLPGKNNVCLVFAIFCAQLFFQFVEFGTKSDIGCKVIGVLIHYFWLVTFGCLSVCSFHMYRVFTSKTGVGISETSRLVIYIVYSYGTPAIIVLLNIIVTRSLSSVTSIGYGGQICFLNQPIAYVVTFAIPISLVCCTNIFFFIATTYKIAKRPKLKNDSQMNLNQIQFTVYVKLFSITGITWIFQIIDSFIPVSAFSTIISLLNALQGVFIFISYVCNRRVLSLYNKTRISFSGYSRTRTSRHTSSTGLSSTAL